MKKKKKNNNKFRKQENLPVSFNESELVLRWIDKKDDILNGLKIKMEKDDCGYVKFELKGKDINEKDYQELLQAKVYDTFGISDINVASTLVTNCINAMLSFSFDAYDLSNIEKVKVSIERYFSDIISLFRELRPCDLFEAMMISKLIIIDLMSTREFIAANSSKNIDQRTIYEARGIKLSRLWCEIKEKLDKHRRPGQQIIVQHNHIYNEGQAIIGSQLSTRGGAIEKTEK